MERLASVLPGSGGMWFEASWTMDHTDPDIAQDRDAALEGWVRGERTVDEGNTTGVCRPTASEEQS